MTRDRSYWDALHVRSDKAAPFETQEPRRPHWIPEWEVKAILAKRKAA